MRKYCFKYEIEYEIEAENEEDAIYELVSLIAQDWQEYVDNGELIDGGEVKED